MTTDQYGRTVVFSTDDVTDTYSVTSDGASFVLEFPAGTDTERVYDTINAMAPETPVVIPVPDKVTRWQAYSIMLATPSFVHSSPATLFSDVQAIVTATGGALQLAWQNQGYLYRQGPFLQALKTLLGLTDEILDNLFIAAANLPE